MPCLSLWRPRFKAPDVAEKRLELKEQTETDRLSRVKEKATYRRFELLPFLAILGCAGMLIFEGIFIFELYDRAPDQVAALLPAVSAPSAETPAAAPAPAATNTAVVPSEVAPAEIEQTPAGAPVG